MAQMTTPPASALGAGGVAGLSSHELGAELTDAFRLRAMADGRILGGVGMAEREETFRDDGATSTEAWLVERYGVSVATARAYTHVGKQASDLPHLVGALCQGDITFDKLRAVVDIATPETDQELCDQARECTVRELADVARTIAERRAAGSTPPARSRSRSEHDSRYLRFNDQCRTMSLQLPAEAYAETKACVDAWAATVPSGEETPLDQRRCDGFTGLMHSATPGSSREATTANPFFVVSHVPLDALVDQSGHSSDLAAELEHDGLIDVETVQRIACDATIAVAVDDDVGHTMYEGRARRFPSGAQRREVIRRDRQCRFPGCTNVTFTNVHHIVPWKPGGGTDLPNLVLLCRHHHGVVHRKDWTMSGNANEELTIVGPTGRVMVSRPSPLWTRVTADPRTGTRAAGGAALED
jgi:hypothetical protein